jgi:hypothetical protein
VNWGVRLRVNIFSIIRSLSLGSAGLEFDAWLCLAKACPPCIRLSIPIFLVVKGFGGLEARGSSVPKKLGWQLTS